MKKSDLGQSIAIFANVGVIAGIAFLGIELRQNNEFLAAEARFNRLAVSTESFTLQATEPDLAEILVKDRSGERLTEVEELRIQSYWTRVFISLEWTLSETGAENWADGQRRNFATYGSYRRAWEGGNGGPQAAGREAYSPGFVEFMETNVVVH